MSVRQRRLALFLVSVLLLVVSLDWVLDPKIVGAPFDQLLAALSLALGAAVACGAGVELAWSTPAGRDRQTP